MAYLGNKQILFSPEVTIVTEGATGYTLTENQPIIAAYTAENLVKINEVNI